jgi:hypothetical protein
MAEEPQQRKRRTPHFHFTEITYNLFFVPQQIKMVHRITPDHAIKIQTASLLNRIAT